MNKPLIISILLTSLICIACSKEETRPSTIYITANVTDKETALPIDSVKVGLYKSDLASFPLIIEYYYTNNIGNVNLSFSPEKYSFGSYSLNFYKSGYLSLGTECGCEVHIDLDKENQHFNVQLIKKQQ